MDESAEKTSESNPRRRQRKTNVGNTREPSQESEPQTTLPPISIIDPLEEIGKVRAEVENAKKDFIAIFGLFAAILIFLSLEVKIFDQPLRMAQIAGISFFFLSALLVFALGIRSIFSDKSGWSEFTKPAFVLAVVFLIISLECFYWGTHTNAVTHHGQYWLFGSQ